MAIAEVDQMIVSRTVQVEARKLKGLPATKLRWNKLAPGNWKNTGHPGRWEPHLKTTS